MYVGHRFVFVHLPKTGGEFLRGVLAKHFPGDVVETGIAKHGSVVDLPEELRELPKFASVRNPWDWHVSWYHYLMGSGRRPAHRERVRATQKMFVRISHDLSADFGTTIRNFYLPDPVPADVGGAWRAVLDQDIDLQTWHLHRQVADDATVVIGRQESLGEDFLAFLDSIGLPVTGDLREDLLSSDRPNRSKHARYHEYYDEELAEEIRRRAAEVIERFGYSF